MLIDQKCMPTALGAVLGGLFVLAAIPAGSQLAARSESLAAFDRRCIPAGCVAPRSNTPGILGRRALPPGRLAGLGATPDFHHGLLASPGRQSRASGDGGADRVVA